VFYGRLARIFKLVKLNKDDVFIDLGCGKGRVVFCAAAGRVKQAIGIDVDEQLIAVARDNSRRARFSRAPVEFIHIDAVDFLCPDTATVFFLFNPFGEKTLAKVMENIKLSWQNNPRVIKIIYYAPACRKVLDQQDWLEFCWPVGDEHCLLWQSRLSASANNRKEILLNNQEIISLVKEVLAKQGVYEFAASGYSMCPFIKSQDSISLSAVKEEILEPGVIAGFVNPQGGQFTVHRIIAVKNGKFLFKGDNCFKPDGWVLDENILGYVCQIKRGLKIISIGLGIEKKAVAFLSRYTPLFPITMRIWKFFRNLF
jgi:SAM-dependent methyltransferase